MGTLDRNLQIRQDHVDGMSYQQLAEKYGISRSRAQQINDKVRLASDDLIEPYGTRMMRRSIANLQAKANRMTLDLSAMTEDLADLDRILQATLLDIGKRP